LLGNENEINKKTFIQEDSKKIKKMLMPNGVGF